jgi:hypothetical protein
VRDRRAAGVQDGRDRDLDLVVPVARVDGHLGFGRIVASEIAVPNLLAIAV